MEPVYQPSESPRPRWVLDTNVVLDWLVFDDPVVRPIARQIEAGDAELVTNAEVRAEFLHVLTYPIFKLSEEGRTRALARYDGLALAWTETMGTQARTLPICRDPSDQKFLVLARDARAEALITRDLRVLRLARRCAELGLFRIVSPGKL